jgi:hypothetical protein
MAHKILAALLIVTLVVTLLISRRDWVLSNSPTVDHVSDIPEGKGAILSNLDAAIDDEGVHFVHPPTKAEILYAMLAAAGRLPQPPAESHYARPRYGYSIREITFLGMPFGWYTEMGYVLYTDNRWELVEGQLVPSWEAEFRKELGRDPKQGFIFPFWAHVWGWAYLAGIALWGWLFHRAIVRRREELGMI